MNIWKSPQGQDRVLTRYEEILQAWPVSHERRYVETSQGRTHIIVSGPENAPPVMLLHGSTSNSFSWMGDIAELAKAHRVYAVDLIGEPGLSFANRASYDSGVYETWLNDLLDQLSIPACSFVGLSLGGWMAVRFAQAFPNRVEQLVLICPGGLAPTKSSFLVKAILSTFFGAAGRRWLWQQINGGKPIDADQDKLKAAIEFSQLISQHFRPRTAPLPVFTTQQLSRLQMPIQLFFGNRDCVLNAPSSVKHISKACPHTHVNWLPDTGHLIVGKGKEVADFLIENAA